MPLLRKTLSLEKENKLLYKELVFGNYSAEEKYKTYFEIAIRHLTMLEYEDFFTNIKSAEDYAQKHYLKDLLAIKLIKLVAFLKIADQPKAEKLKNELCLNNFDTKLLAKIALKLNNYSELLPAFENFLADIYLLYHQLDQNYYQNLNTFNENYHEHVEKTNQLVDSSYPEEQKEIMILLSLAVIKVAKKNSRYSDSCYIDLMFARSLERLFSKKAAELIIFYQDKALANISKEQIKELIIERAELIKKYDEINNLEKIIEHGKILMTYCQAAERYNPTILDASQIFLNAWSIYNKNQPVSKKEIDKMLTYVKENLKICLDCYFAEHQIEYTGKHDLTAMYIFFKKDATENNRPYISFIDNYAEILDLNKII